MASESHHPVILNRMFLSLAVGILIGLTSRSATALTINRNFIPSGSSFPSIGVLAASQPGTVAGGGNLTAIFNRAADIWESAILDSHTVSISFGWAPLASPTLGTHNLLTQSGSPNRETSATIRFDSDGSSNWFLDSTPADDSEWTTFGETSADYGGGTMNDGRRFTGYTGPLVSGSTPIDLFSTAMHEIGHALGLASANISFATENGDLDIDVVSPRPFTGAILPTISGAHLNIGTASTRSLMYPSTTTGIRKYPTDVDIVANAEISDFNSLNLNYFQTAEAIPLPEPNTLVLCLLGSAIFKIVRRRDKR